MEKIYRKKENGRYEEIGYSSPDLQEGIWFVRKQPGIRTTKNLDVQFADLPKPLDLSLLSSLLQHEDFIINVINNLENKPHSKMDFANEFIKHLYKKIKQNSEIIYLAIPYTWNPEESYKIANEVAAELISQGKVVFSPISHSHPIADYMEESKRCDFDLWMKEDLPILRVCSKIIFIVVGENGMELIDNSKGCQREMREAIIANKPISYYHYSIHKGDYKKIG